MIRRTVWAVVLCSVAAGIVHAEDAFFHLALNDLEITEGKLPVDDSQWRGWWNRRGERVYAVLDGEGEVYLRYDVNNRRRLNTNDPAFLREIAVRVPQARDITGKIYVPESDSEGNREGMRAVSFRISANQASVEDRELFYQMKLAHYERLLRSGNPGAAWFRHEAREARASLGQEDRTGTNRVERFRTGRLEETYAMFTGGRAMSENLQLDRVLQPADDSSTTVALDSITGITVQEIDWTELLAGKDSELDPLATYIPADQHAVFFPSFAAAATLTDEFKKQGATVLQLAEPRSTNARTLERYQKQMCLELTTLSRLLGPAIVKSVAVTGSDPYFRTGTDVAVLFQTDDPATLEKLLSAQVALSVAETPDAKPVDGDVSGLEYRGLRNDSRSVCTYMARSKDVVIVTNSLHQLEQYTRVSTGKTPALATLDEYKFFRHRYRRNDEGETAFLFLSDAAIRRWCGPRWRIGTSRRTRDGAVVAELQASQLDRLVNGNVQPGPMYTDLPLGEAGEIELTRAGVRSSTVGSLAFMTPIAEMKIDRVSKAEADAYRQWRNRYQGNWRWAFDPIGLRLGVADDRLAADLTVMPLIWGTDYREVISFSRGAEFGVEAGDKHNTLAHLIMAINTQSPQLQRQTNMLRMLTGDLKVEPLSWLGANIGVYFDEDPFWQEVAEVPQDDLDEFLEEQGWNIPAAFRAEVSSGLKLTLFLGAVRAFIEQASPGMLNWETLDYKDQPYVRITPTERAIGRTEQVRNLAIYYSASGESLTLTVNEDVLKRSIDRQLAREEAAEDVEAVVAGPGWLGSNLGLQADEGFLRVLAALGRESYQRTMQDRAWSNLPILNEWKRRYVDQDPVGLHQRFWQERLVCPGGGKYVWNEQWQTMESTVYGCPAVPKQGPVAPVALTEIKHGNFGLTFEQQGLRTRVELKRAAGDGSQDRRHP